MSKDKIIASALTRFAKQGYYHTSLAEIAEDVGIRKPSIYAHFPSKEKIFLTLLQEAFNQEKLALSVFDFPRTPRDDLRGYFFKIPVRYATDKYLPFWIRTIYMPPYDLEDKIKEYDHRYSQMIDAALAAILQRIENESGLLRPQLDVIDAFTGLLRGIHAELLYNSVEEAEKKARGMWSVFELVFSRQPQNNKNS